MGTMYLYINVNSFQRCVNNLACATATGLCQLRGQLLIDMQEQLVLKSYGGVTPQEDFVVTYPCWVLARSMKAENVKTGSLSVWKRNLVYSKMERLVVVCRMSFPPSNNINSRSVPL